MTSHDKAQHGHDTGPDGSAGPVAWPYRLSTKLLLLTIVSVLIAEVLIFIPSVANFRLRWL
ncbi:MAG: hypothetical protein ABJZ74_11895, partial [Nitratireductor sp.]